jgi:hypothetical protein
MASKEKKIESHLKLALEEIGDIKPWFSKKFKSWIFSHDLYPVEYAGDTKEEVIQNYPLYVKEFIKHRLQNRLSPLMENKTKGHGGNREGAGRAKGSKEEKVRVYLPKDIAKLLKEPHVLVYLRGLMHACHNNHTKM